MKHTGESNIDNYSSYMSNKGDKELTETKPINRRSISPYQRNYSPGRKKNVEIKKNINTNSNTASQKGILKSGR